MTGNPGSRRLMPFTDEQGVSAAATDPRAFGGLGYPDDGPLLPTPDQAAVPVASVPPVVSMPPGADSPFVSALPVESGSAAVSLRGKTLEQYRCLRYPIRLTKCEEGGYFAEIEDLPGCMSQGETRDEALKMIEDARLAWIETALKRGMPVPEPGRTKR